MSKFGNVWIKSVYCLMMFALLAAALVLSGCSGYGAGFDNGSGSASADLDSSTDSVSDGTDTPDITASVTGMIIVGFVAVAFCVLGAVFLGFYNEKKIMKTIEKNDRAE